jgi:RHS repeat-associated protein
MKSFLKIFLLILTIIATTGEAKASAVTINSQHATGHEHLDAFKIINMNGRLYDPLIGRFFSPDPYVQLPEFSQNFNRYSYCLNNPLALTDPSGERFNPIFDWEGIFLGTDDLGIQGEAIIMNNEYFRQGMSHLDALDKGTLRSQLPQIMNVNFLDKIDNQVAAFPNRPDWDGYLTLQEANDWYRNGNGQPLFVDLGKIDLSGLYSLGEKYVGQEKVFNLLLWSGSINDGLVYGQVKFKRYPNHSVRAYADKYDFDMKSWWNPLNWGRNMQTVIGGAVAGQGTGYNINIYDSKTLKPKWPWTK